MEVRRLQRCDSAIGVQAIQRLKTPDGYPTPSNEYLERFLAKRENVFVVAVDEVPVGFAVGYMLDRIDRDQPMMFFYEIGVAESRRQEGIGRQLIEVLKGICRDENIMKMWVPTARSNIAAMALYASTGGIPFPNDDEVTHAYPPETFGTAR